ncbi:hypothetical protein [Roseovarius sp. D22-M7]|uniref:hypothetical protein n=1 Tax=Roseovarius sp. D22-M7 TaxID=3127116 RepID=UPI003010220E
MAIFDSKSRYARFSTRTGAIDAQGRPVACVTPAKTSVKPELGLHRRNDFQRLDHLAAHYLNDPAGYWELLDANDALTTEAVARAEFIRIPVKG